MKADAFFFLQDVWENSSGCIIWFPQFGWVYHIPRLVHCIFYALFPLVWILFNPSRGWYDTLWIGICIGRCLMLRLIHYIFMHFLCFGYCLSYLEVAMILCRFVWKIYWKVPIDEVDPLYFVVHFIPCDLGIVYHITRLIWYFIDLFSNLIWKVPDAEVDPLYFVIHLYVYNFDAYISIIIRWKTVHVE